MLQIIYTVCIISTILLIINRNKLNTFWVALSSLIGLIGGALSLVFVSNFLSAIIFLLWCPGLPLFLAQSSKIYEIKRVENMDNSNETCTEKPVEQEKNYTTTVPLTDEIFTCYASFLTLILKSCQYDKCGTYMKMKLDSIFLLYIALGKGSDCVPQDFPLQHFLQQTETFVFSFGLDSIIQKTKMTASENEIKFCKMHLINFANICRKEIGSPAPIKQATYICDAIS